MKQEARSGDGRREEDANSSKPRIYHGARRRGSSPVGVQRGWGGAARDTDGSRVPHPLPIHHTTFVLPSCRLPVFSLQPRPRHRPRRLPLGRSHFPLRHLQQVAISREA